MTVVALECWGLLSVAPCTFPIALSRLSHLRRLLCASQAAPLLCAMMGCSSDALPAHACRLVDTQLLAGLAGLARGPSHAATSPSLVDALRLAGLTARADELQQQAEGDSVASACEVQALLALHRATAAVSLEALTLLTLTPAASRQRTWVDDALRA